MGTSPPPLYSRYDNIDIENSNSVDLAVLVEELRPQEPYISGDQMVLWVRHDYDSPISGTWTVTAKLRLEVEEITDITEVVRNYLRSPEEDDD